MKSTVQLPASHQQGFSWTPQVAMRRLQTLELLSSFPASRYSWSGPPNAAKFFGSSNSPPVLFLGQISARIKLTWHLMPLTVPLLVPSLWRGQERPLKMASQSTERLKKTKRHGAHESSPSSQGINLSWQITCEINFNHGSALLG